MGQDAIWESADRSWFRDHAGEKIRVRRSYEGEFDGGQVEAHAQFCIRYAGYRDEDIIGIGAHTIVVKIDEATRFRLPYWRAELSDSDLDRIPVEAELADGGKTTTLSGFLRKLDDVTKVAGAATEKYLEEILPTFVVDSLRYDGDKAPDADATGMMLACFELTADEDSSEPHEIRKAGEADHARHTAACGGYDPSRFPAVLVVQPYPGFCFRMPFPREAMRESDNYRFKITAGGREGTLGDYIRQARNSFMFAVKMM